MGRKQRQEIGIRSLEIVETNTSPPAGTSYRVWALLARWVARMYRESQSMHVDRKNISSYTVAIGIADERQATGQNSHDPLPGGKGVQEEA
jgi:hypothetical protein